MVPVGAGASDEMTIRHSRRQRPNPIDSFFHLDRTVRRAHGWGKRANGTATVMSMSDRFSEPVFEQRRRLLRRPRY